MNDNFPISKSGIKCIGPCYEKGKTFTHPELLIKIKNDKNNLCPTNKFIDENNEVNITDLCNKPSNEIQKYNLGLFAITPTINFNGNYFLRIYYNIFSLDDAILWINNNKHLPKKTINRILNLSILEFLKNESLIDSRLINIFLNFFNKNINNLFLKLKNNISIKNNHVNFIKKNKNTNLDYFNEKEIIEKFLKKKIINENYINKFITKYVKSKKKKNWKNNQNHLMTILNDFSDYTIKKIELT